eukprot:scaffold4784_cov229-Alexandrium_tamarense.AAC.10
MELLQLLVLFFVVVATTGEPGLEVDFCRDSGCKMSFQDDTVCGKDCGVGFSDETCKCTAADEPACNAPCEATSFCQLDNGWQWSQCYPDSPDCGDTPDCGDDMKCTEDYAECLRDGSWSCVHTPKTCDAE